LSVSQLFECLSQADQRDGVKMVATGVASGGTVSLLK
jgi:hypothetical protein